MTAGDAPGKPDWGAEGPEMVPGPPGDRLDKRIRLLTFLGQLGCELGSLEVGEVMSRSVEAARRVTGAAAGGILALEEQGQASVVIPPGPGRPARESEAIRLVLGRGVAAWVAGRRRGAVVADVQVDPQWKDLRRRLAGIHSVLYFPLLRQDQLRGILALVHPQPDHFASFHLTLLTAAAPQMVLALENARLYRSAARAQERLQTILTNLTDALLVLDAAGTVVLTNPTLERLVGRPGSALQGQRFSEVIPLRYGARPSPIEGVLKGQYVSFEMDLWLVSRNGEEIPIRLGCGALPGEQGKLAGAVIVMRDIRYLREIEQLRDDMTDLLVHDLKSPLASIASTIQLLIQYPLRQMEQETIRDLLSIAERSSRRLTRMVESILDTERLEASQFPLEMATASLPRLVAEVVEELAPVAAEGGVETRVRIPAGLPQVRADREIVQRVVWNLLDNALKYTPQGGLIEVVAKELVLPGKEDPPDRPQELPAGRWIVVSVSDTGPGIPPEDQERIFDKFAQARLGRGRRRGTGLGLTFCRLAVESHGGRIWVKSQLGQGSTFSFLLPVA